jgi:RNA polymerase sigma-70 factor (ECF subfamily)
MKPNRRDAGGVPAADSDDAAILARVADGDLGALGELYDRHHHAVRAFLSRATSNAGDVDDLLQNTFLSAARIAARFDGRAASRPWLIGIAANLVQRRGRGLGQFARFVARIATEKPPSGDPHPALEARSSLRRVAEAVSRMDTAKRVVILMAEVEGMACQEIADALSIPIGTVWGRLHAARRELRAALPDEETS